MGARKTAAFRLSSAKVRSAAGRRVAQRQGIVTATHVVLAGAIAICLALVRETAAVPAGQHIICCNQLVDVGGNWVGASRVADCRDYMRRSPEARTQVCSRIRASGLVCEEAAAACDGRDDTNDAPSCAFGSVIEIQNQVLRESVPITGTSFTLNYSSEHVRTGRYTPERLASETLGGWTLDVHHRYDPSTRMLYLGDGGRLESAAAQGPASELHVPADDGSQMYIFDPAGRHLRTLQALTRSTRFTFEYDSSGVLHRVNERDEATLIRRDENGIVLTAPHGQQTQLAVNDRGYAQSITNPAGEMTRLMYSAGYLVGTIGPMNQRSTYSFDDAGRLTKRQGPDRDSLSIGRAVIGNGLEFSMESALGRKWRALTESSTGGTRRVITTPGGAERQEVQRAEGRTVTYADGTVIAVAGATNALAAAGTTPVRTTVTTPGGIKATVVRRETRDAGGFTETTTVNGRQFVRRFDTAARTLTSTSPSGQRRVATVDDVGRLIRWEANQLAPILVSYDRGRVSSIRRGDTPDAASASIAYDAAGYPSSVTDALKQTMRIEHDRAGRPTRHVLADGSAIAFSYDANGAVRSIVPPGRPAHRFEYTPAGLLARYQPPSGSDVRYAYNADEQLVVTEWAGREVLKLDYDPAGRLSTIASPGATLLLSYLDQTDRVRSIAERDQATSFEYDGLLHTATVWEGTINGRVARAYDADLRLRALTINTGAAVPFTYDSDGRLQRAGDLRLERDAATGFVDRARLGDVVTTENRDRMGALARVGVAFKGRELFAVDISRDLLGRITRATEAAEGGGAVFGYRYDAAGRLNEVTRDGQLLRRYAYDANGNRSSEAPGDTSATYDDQDRLLTHDGSTFTYNDGGQLLTRTSPAGKATFGYDTLGALRRADLPDGTRIEYIIDGIGRRIGRRVNGASVQGFLYDKSSRLIAELDAAGAVAATFVYTDGDAPAYMRKGTRILRIAVDHVGSVRRVIDTATGEVVQALDYDPFGRVLRDTNPGFQPFGFAGGLYDPLTGFLRFGARDYDPAAGRWTAADPDGLVHGTNRYAYVENDPINRRDPSGRASTGGYGIDIWSQAEAYIERYEQQTGNAFDDIMRGGRGHDIPPPTDNPSQSRYRPIPPEWWHEYILPGPEGFPETDGYNIHWRPNVRCSVGAKPDVDLPIGAGHEHVPGRRGDPTAPPPPGPVGPGVVIRFGNR